MVSSRPSPPCPSPKPAGGAAEVAEESRDAQQQPPQSELILSYLADPPSKMGIVELASRATACAGPVVPADTPARGGQSGGARSSPVQVRRHATDGAANGHRRGERKGRREDY
jgi:hypothetical protein